MEGSAERLSKSILKHVNNILSLNNERHDERYRQKLKTMIISQIILAHATASLLTNFLLHSRGNHIHLETLCSKLL